MNYVTTISHLEAQYVVIFKCMCVVAWDVIFVVIIENIVRDERVSIVVTCNMNDIFISWDFFKKKGEGSYSLTEPDLYKTLYW